MLQRRAEELREAEREGWDLEPLQLLSVSRSVRRKYRRLLQAFRRWLGRRGSTFRAGSRLDSSLARYLTEKFAGGLDLGEAQKLMAAVKFALPLYGRFGQLELPCSMQAMSGWRKRNPPRARLPLPWEAFAAIVVWLVLQRQEWELAVGLVIAFHAYLRPIDLFSLKVGQVIAPVGRSRSARRWSLLLHPRERGRPSKAGHSTRR